MITLSFDDGWRSIYENALPLLEKAGLKSAHYVISGYLDDKQFPRYMNLNQIRDLSVRGHEIGCHTASHLHLPEESQSIIEEEILLSAKYLKNAGLSVETFAYPYGEYNDRILAVVKNAGFKGARSVIPGYNTNKTDPFLLQCQAVKVDTTLEEVKAWIDASQRDTTWLILMFHQIDHEGRAWSTTPEMLEAILGHVKISGAAVVTVAEGLKKS